MNASSGNVLCDKAINVYRKSVACSENRRMDTLTSYTMKQALTFLLLINQKEYNQKVALWFLAEKIGTVLLEEWAL